MAQTQVEIEVELSGSGKVEKGLQKIEGGLEGLGETGSKLSDALGSTNEKLGEGLEAVSGTVGEVRSAFGELGGAITTLGQTGSKGFTAMLGPLGLLVSAGLAVYETFRLITGAAQEAEEAEAAMSAAAADLESKLESLAEKGVILSTKELLKFSQAVLESQLGKEAIQEALTKQKKTFQAVAEAQRELNRLTEISTNLEKDNFRARMDALAGLSKARSNLAKAIAKEEKALANLNAEQRKVSEGLQRAGKLEEEHEKRGTDQLRNDALKLLNLEKEIKLIDAREFTLAKSEGRLRKLGEVEAQYLETKEKLEDASRKEIKSMIAGMKERNKGINEAFVARKKNQEAIDNLEADAIEKEVEQYESSRKILAAKRKTEREQRFRKEVALQTRIQQIEIKMTKSGIDQAFALESLQHEATLKLIKKNSLEEQLEEKRHELALRTISERAIQEDDMDRELELQKIQDQHLKRVELEYTLAQKMLEAKTQGQGFGTELEKIQFESDQELALLQLQYDQEIEMAKIKGEELISIQERFALDRLAITKQSTQEQAEILSDYFAEYSEGFAQAGFNALFFGESFQEATSQVLKSLAQQAVSQSVMKAAEGFGLLAMGLPGSALAFKSSALFAAAASVAGVASNALGGGGAAQTGASPSGQPSTAPTPEREQVTNDSMVFNINFGGAVVYDTKKAAEQALADRLVSIINTPRRGAVQFNRR
jgi:hypothetical protein